MLVAALNGLFPHDACCIFEKINDYDIVQIAVRVLEDLTGWKFNNKDNSLASIINYTTKDLSNYDIIPVDESSLVVAAIERNRQYMPNKAKWKIKLLKEKGL